MFWGLNEKDVLNLVIESLMKQTYECMLLINVEKNLAREYCFGENAENKEIANVVRIEDADEWLSHYFKDNYVGDDIYFLLSEIKIATMVQHLTETPSVSFSYSVYEKGEIRRKCVDYKYLYSDKKLICMTRTDITKKYQEEKRQAEIVEHSLQIAQDAVQAKSDFLLNISQDIRTPLNNLSNMLNLAIRQKQEGKDETEYLLMAKKSMDQLNDMIEKLLDMAVIEMGQLDFNPQPIVLKSFLEEIANSLEPLAKKKNQSVIFDVDSTNIRMIKSDPANLRQVFMIIMDNSLRYGFENGYAKCHISFQKSKDNEMFTTLTFTDNGRGMTDEMVVKAFENFYAPEIDSNEGLGLPIAQNIVRQSGGNITLQSEIGVGTTVTVHLPVMELSGTEEEFKTQLDHMVRHMDELDFTNFKALIIDANEISREVIELRLKKFGLQVDSMSDGQKALERLLHSQNNEYHIVFSDIQLPSLSGLDLTRKLRESKRRDLSDMPIVALTAHAYRDERLDALECGMDYHLPLPVNDIELKEILVKELLALSPQREYEVRRFRIIK